MRREIKYLCDLERVVLGNVAHIWIATIKNEALIIHLISFVFCHLPAIVSELPGNTSPPGVYIAYFPITAHGLYKMNH